jgi:ATP/maltotriose-dependent transcriptional regulator MalT
VLLAQLLDERGEHTQTERLLRSIDPTLLTPQARTRAALIRADNLFFGLGRERESKDVLLEAERSALDIPTGELTANRAWIELHTGDVRGALDTVTSIASSDRQGRVAADIVTAWGRAVLGDTSGAFQVAEQAAISDQPPSYPAVSRHEGFPGLARGQALLHAGDLEEAEDLARAGWAAALGSGPGFLQARWATLLGSILLERGQAKAAVSTFRQAVGLQRRLGQTGLMRVNLSRQVLAAVFAGIQPQDEAALEELDQLPRTPERLFDADELSARAWHAAARGERSTAAQILREAAALARKAGLVPIEVRLQHDLVRLGHAEEVVDRLAELASLTDSTSVQARVRHAVACADGDPQLIEAAAATFEDLGLLLLAAEAYAAAAADYSRSGRRQAHACRRRAAELDRHCQGIQSPAMVVGDQAAPLTPREREVVTMAAQGLPSKIIAKRLFVSLRTVNNTIQRAYVKLGVHSREEAADALNLDGSQSVTSRS